MLQNLHETSNQKLLPIFNTIYQQQVCPKQWRTAIVLSFHKTSKPLNEASSYRPIALTGCVGKLLEKIVYNTLINLLESERMISKFQYGLSQCRSTTDSLVKLATDILTAFQCKEHTIAVFFDMTKAYDHTWRHGILRSIHEKGIRGNIAIFIKNFFTNGQFKTKINTSLSSEHPKERKWEYHKEVF